MHFFSLASTLLIVVFFIVKEDELSRLVNNCFDNAIIDVKDISGNGRYYRVTIISCIFNDMTLIERHRYFYSHVWDKICCYVDSISLILKGVIENE